MFFNKLIYSHNYRIRISSTVSETGTIGLLKNVTRRVSATNVVRDGYPLLPEIFVVSGPGGE